ncbi:DNA-binding response regulator, NarL/FixJ family, contains REC and HTH domains [Geodermatophilus ruber]|uniref:DNA-binding response regulator, NarL/FixJ family, contains REC and HTH domains n=2 Tax=Geodermatophilus ruber TaxID=504800 RepID=A0A1I4BJ67_9ACTN|nr:DNA-binding response regulator, NarL/FixJ family, contains REC and HTH domains [Geodermatophilus ruber]
MDRVPICVSADDPVSQAGLMSQLRPRPEVTVLGWEDERVRVAVVVADTVDEKVLRTLRTLQRRNCRALLVVTSIDDAALANAVEAGMAGLLRRADATSERLAHAVCSVAKGDGTVPPDLLGRLLAQVGRVQRQLLSPRGFTLTGLSEREIEILRLIADGFDTAEIATALSYSERTVKNVLHDVTSRLQLRNRSHAVAYALKQGMI